MGGGPITVTGAPNTQGSMFSQTKTPEAKPRKVVNTGARKGRQRLVIARHAAIKIRKSPINPNHRNSRQTVMTPASAQPQLQCSVLG